jgi:hypothetical protein
MDDLVLNENEELIEELSQGTLSVEPAPLARPAVPPSPTSKRKIDLTDPQEEVEPPKKKVRVINDFFASQSAQAAPSSALPDLQGKDRPNFLATPIPSAISDPRAPSYVPVAEDKLKRSPKVGHTEKEAQKKAIPHAVTNASSNTPQSVIRELQRLSNKPHYLTTQGMFHNEFNYIFFVLANLISPFR